VTYMEQYIGEEKQLMLIPLCSEQHWHLLMVDFQKEEIAH